MKEYETTCADLLDYDGHHRWPGKPCPPDGAGWRLVAMAASSDRLFWAWERDNKEEK